MTIIDLTIFAEHSQKLPSRLLAPLVKREKFSTLKLLIAHGADMCSTMIMMSIISSCLVHSLNLIIISKGFDTFSDKTALRFTLQILPFFVFNYFFFCYFMNSGQSYGMFLMKKRIQMKSKSFVPAFKWASRSTILCFSFGLSHFIEKKIWSDFQAHDHLYHELISHHEEYTVDILLRGQEFKKAAPEEEIWSKAA